MSLNEGFWSLLHAKAGGYTIDEFIQADLVEAVAVGRRLRVHGQRWHGRDRLIAKARRSVLDALAIELGLVDLGGESGA